MYQNLAIVFLFVLAYSLVAGRLERTPVNGAVVYVAFGVLFGPIGLGLLDLNIEREGIRLLAEMTLALVLFADASNANLDVVRRNIRLPGRMLLLGLPFAILLGFGFGVLLFPGLGLLEVAILATMLAPTDAALGKAVISNPVVPAPVREGLNVESGLNDGICVPILLTFLALATVEGGGKDASELALTHVAEEIGIGLVIGVGLTVVASWVLKRALQRSWLQGAWLGVPIAALAFSCFTLAQFSGGSGFIACFAGGLVFSILAPKQKHELLERAEGMGEALSLATWVAFGAAVVLQQHPESVDWHVVLYAVLSLTVVRMVPIYLSLMGLGMRPSAKLFVGWFGPRGLASIVFLAIVMEDNLPGNDTMVATVMTTVVLSIVAHGLSANPLAARFGARTQSESA
jgi:NhaP-type Na+/H+ or K+/H+ antiporter